MLKNDAYGEFVSKKQKQFVRREKYMDFGFKIFGFFCILGNAIGIQTTALFSSREADTKVNIGIFLFNMVF
jgi:hypothetical protein